MHDHFDIDIREVEDAVQHRAFVPGHRTAAPMHFNCATKFFDRGVPFLGAVDFDAEYALYASDEILNCRHHRAQQAYQ